MKSHNNKTTPSPEAAFPDATTVHPPSLDATTTPACAPCDFSCAKARAVGLEELACFWALLVVALLLLLIVLWLCVRTARRRRERRREKAVRLAVAHDDRHY